MRGLEICRAYFETYGLPMLQDAFPGLLPRIACGLTGSGSECFGFDDEVSRDHDFEPGFCLFLPGEETVGRREAFRLERAYAGLPREFMGLRRSLVQPVGGPRRGVMRLADFFRDRTGSPDGCLTLREWLSLPGESLAEAVNGEVFWDWSGELTAIRSRLARYPEDVRRKKLAGHLLLMAQSGQYNYARCLRHGESAAAQLAAVAFAEGAAQAVFLLNDVYPPFYKWRFRAMRALPCLALEAELLEYLITTDNGPDLARDKQEAMEGIAADVAKELRRQGLTELKGSDLERQAYAVQSGIRDGDIRTLSILAGV